MGKYTNMWPMRQPHPLRPEVMREIYKCIECGAETAPAGGHNGEPDRHRCGPGCRCNAKLHTVSPAKSRYNDRFDAIFPTAPGAGI